MEESDTTLQKTFTIFPRHIVFLEGVNENTSLALRTVLDSIVSGENQLRKKQIIDGMVTYVSFGLICMLLSYIVSNVCIMLVCIMLGVFLFAYGLIGGVLGALQRTGFRIKRRR